ncbi:MAG TPA: M50 family metallopeptidase [Verrucomicrobiae bacterium]|nr:M50 family metallopeptidase [Verrucomicrobiae bacterium]
MMPTRQGSIRLFQIAGITVFLHWSWFIVAAYEIQDRGHDYSSLLWNVLEYLALFAIVTMHEFGHALACRSVGGKANQIVLWPLGGVAYVDPPPRPGAVLWSIAAGPLVNVALFPVLTLVLFLAKSVGWPISSPDAYALISNIWTINLMLLIFNLLPIYPLDGGQILQSLLWFGLGRARSLMVAAAIGFVGAAGVAILAILAHSLWIGLITAFIVMNCVRGWRVARALARLAAMPRHEGLACPACHAAPPRGALWKCGKCGTAFDTFLTQAVCPNCGTQFESTRCIDCGAMSPISAWLVNAPVPPPVPSV